METTLAIVKPDAYKNGYAGKIIDRIIKEGFAIDQMKQILMTKEKAEGFYEVHKERPFFGELVTFMSRSPIIVAVLKKKNAVEDFRKLIGSTNPDKAEKGTVRKLFATSMGENAIHGSDSADNAQIESSFFFSGREIY